MVHKRLRTIVMAATVLISSAAFVSAQTIPACATVANLAGTDVSTGLPFSYYWTDTTGGGTWTLSQASNGTITGQFLSVTTGSCEGSSNYSVSGNYQGNGQYTVTATYTGSDNINCVSSLTETGTLAQPGCDHASVSWVNSQSTHGSANWSSMCVVPDTETTPAFVQWYPAGSSYADFHQSLIFTRYSASFNWQGRKVTESFPSNGTDNCYFSGSRVPQQLTRSSETVALDSPRRV